MKPLLILTVFACFLPVTGSMAAQPSPTTRPATTPATQPAAITLVRLEPRTNDAGATFHLMHLRFSNNSDQPLHFQGYGSTPFLSRMILRDGQWSGADLHDWCGTGLARQTIAAGQSSEFTTVVPFGVDVFRLGTQVRGSPEGSDSYVWSEPIRLPSERRQ